MVEAVPVARFEGLHARWFARRGVRLAAWTLWALAGLAVLAPFVCDARPYCVRAAEPAALRRGAEALVASGATLARLAAQSDAEFLAQRLAGSTWTREAALERERAYLAHELERLAPQLPAALQPELAAARSALDEVAGLDRQLRGLAASVAELRDEEFLARSEWPLFAALEPLSVLALGAWAAAAVLLPVRRPRRAPRARTLWAGLAGAVLLALAWGLVRPAGDELDPAAWKRRLAEPGVRVERAHFAPLPFHYAETNSSEAWRPPTWLDSDAAVLVRYGEPAGDAALRHPLGTDGLGRDLAARLAHGARTSLAVGIGAALLLATLGTLLGALAGALGGLVDLAISRLIEVVLCFPAFFLVLACASLTDARVLPPALFVALVIAFVGWTGVARLVRAECLRVRELDFVLVARAQGFSSARIVFTHILPNALAPALVALSFAVGSAILIESALSFLGLGVEVPVPSWGALASETRNPALWWALVFPGACIFATALCANVLGEALRDALDPRAEVGRG